MNVQARISKEWRRRMTMMALMLNGSALWFCYDGFIAWPSEEARYQQLVTLTAGSLAVDETPTDKNPEVVRAWTAYAAANKLPEKLPKHRSEGDLSGQRTIGGILLAIGLGFVGWVLLQHRKSVRADGDIITGAGGETVHLDTIVDMDRRKWANKGIAYAIYEVDGKRRRLCLDDHKFIGCEAIILEAERRIAARSTPPATDPTVVS
ncbi:hypothetical protein [Rariglobus hedericola]|uniref:Uncharacterized protein n=1 Tax=Rariglobus hedericola TaxID=2597822 RepID=A0A556QSN0_9BACT|nr:hypothetical protein [Rariglobus hedericola]TSJ79641.1 hypothetical protein FPL22_10250 [Rariglobus hedericola]